MTLLGLYELTGRRQAITWNNAGLLLIEPLETNFSKISIGIQTVSFKKIHLDMLSAKWRPFCLGLNVLTLLVSKPEYFKQTRPIPWLLIWPGAMYHQVISSHAIVFAGQTGPYPSRRRISTTRKMWLLRNDKIPNIVCVSWNTFSTVKTTVKSLI